MNRSFRRQPQRKQGGFLMVMLAFTLLTVSWLAIHQQTKAIEARKDDLARAQGSALEVIRNAGADYLTRWRGQIIALNPGDPVTLTVGDGAGAVSVPVARWDEPTIAELVALGRLSAGYSPESIIGGAYRFRIEKIPAGCTVPDCNLEGMVYINAQYTTDGEVDYARAGIAATRVGADGGFSTRSNPGEISGVSRKWVVPNPVGATVGGVLAARFGYSSSPFAAYYRLDGSDPLTGPMNANGNSISNVSTLTATGIIRAGEFSTPAKGVGDACTENNAIASGNGLAMLCVAGTWRTIMDRGNPGEACNPEGKTAISNANGEQLVCKNGSYIRLMSLVAKNIEVQRMLVTDGMSVAKPTCDAGGTPDYSLITTQVTLDLSVAPPKQAQYVTTTDNGSSWSVVLRLRDDTGTETSGNNYNLSAVMRTECRY